MTYTKEQIDRANQTDLVSFLQAQGEQLERAGQEYRWKRHDSLTVRENRWYRHSAMKKTFSAVSPTPSRHLRFVIRHPPSAGILRRTGAKVRK